MTSDPLDELRRELAAMSVSDGPSFLHWMRLAARLAALGDPASLARWPVLLAGLGLDLESLLRDFAIAKLLELRRGAARAEDLVVIQDLACLMEFEAEILPAAGVRAIEALLDECESCLLDDEAKEGITGFLADYPITESLLLPTLVCPRSRHDAALLATLAPKLRTAELGWLPVKDSPRDPGRPGTPSPEIFSTADDRIACAVLDHARNLWIRLKQDSEGMADVSFSLQPPERPRQRRPTRSRPGSVEGLRAESMPMPMAPASSVFEFESMAEPRVRREEKAVEQVLYSQDEGLPRCNRRPPRPFRVSSVRLGLLGASAADRTGNLWTIDPTFLPRTRREGWFDQPLVVVLHEALRLIIS